MEKAAGPCALSNRPRPPVNLARPSERITGSISRRYRDRATSSRARISIPAFARPAPGAARIPSPLPHDAGRATVFRVFGLVPLRYQVDLEVVLQFPV